MKLQQRFEDLVCLVWLIFWGLVAIPCIMLNWLMNGEEQLP